MATLPLLRIGELLEPYYPGVSQEILAKLSNYLDLLIKWNLHINLTAIRTPEEMVRRHFGESLFAARHLPAAETLLDLGSGAGFPGLPIQLARPELQVTLAESQAKKSAFLREAVRLLELRSEVWGARVETMPVTRRFDVVTTRAVDAPSKASAAVRDRVNPGGWTVELTTHRQPSGIWLAIPGSERGYLHLSRSKLFHVEQSE